MNSSVYGKDIARWQLDYPLIAPLMALEPVTWFNPAVVPFASARRDIALSSGDVEAASERLARFAPFLAARFPEVAMSGGIIESPLTRVNAFAHALAQRYALPDAPRVLLKQDSHLPISGSIKARGGIYEVLAHAEQLAIRHGLLTRESDYRILGTPPCQALFQQHKIAVGSTGNLGLSIGIASAALGFHTTVHMSADARQWKKDRLRAHGVTVVEYTGDYGQAVETGRHLAAQDPACHFVDDENSSTLFLGYATAGERVKQQLADMNIAVDREHPLFVYLPCGVGGGPGGVAFGLKLAFGDAVHCLFAEPTQSPCMLMGVYTGLHEALAVQDFGIANQTAADGLAVGRPSGFVGRGMQRMIDGYLSVSDTEMFALLSLMARTEGIRLEPSALAGAPGPGRVLADGAAAYRARMGLDAARMARATHMIWATGGGMVPEPEMAQYLAAGARAEARPEAEAQAAGKAVRP